MNATQPMARRWVALIVVGAIASLLIAGTGLTALSSVYSADAGRIFGIGGTPTNCLPSDFPRYPGSAVVLSIQSFNLCTTAYTSTDTSENVLGYFLLQLAHYPWQETANNSNQGTVEFARDDGRKGSGELSVNQARTMTQFQVVYQT